VLPSLGPERRGEIHTPANGGWTGSTECWKLTSTRRITTSGSGDLKERVGYLDQERPLYKSFRVAEMLRFGCEEQSELEHAVARSTWRSSTYPYVRASATSPEASKRRLALTLCLAKEPELLLLDEPAAALDPVARDELLDPHATGR